MFLDAGPQVNSSRESLAFKLKFFEETSVFSDASAGGNQLTQQLDYHKANGKI